MTGATSEFTDVAEIRADVERTFVYEHGWQSWSPTGLYRAVSTSPRPPDAGRQIMGLWVR
jgi:alpha-galactosidase